MLSSKVSEIMTGDAITADASSAIFAVMETMAANNVGGVVITENQAPAGIFTEQDVLKRVMGKKMDPKETAVKKVMTAPIRAVSQDTHIIEALGRMYKGKFRHLLVRDEKRAIVGMVSMRDILKLAVEVGQGLAENRTIGSTMSRKIVSVDGSQSIYETIETMIRKNTACVVVLIAGEPKGIFTERDLLKRVAIRDMETKEKSVREAMTPNLITMPHSALVGEVLAEMYRRGFRNIPIRGEKGELIGIVTMEEVLKCARALDVDENVRKAWKEIEEFWDSEDQYTPG